MGTVQCLIGVVKITEKMQREWNKGEDYAVRIRGKIQTVFSTGDKINKNKE